MRLKDQWSDEYERLKKRDLSDKHYVCVWAVGIYASKKQCMLILMGVTADRWTALIAVLDGYRESEQSWRKLFLDLKNRGLTASKACRW